MRCDDVVPSDVSDLPLGFTEAYAYPGTMRSSSRVSSAVAGLAGLLVTAAASSASAAPVVAGDAASTSSLDGLSHHDPAERGLVLTSAAGVHGTARTMRGVEWQRRVSTSSAAAASGTAAAAPGAVDPWSQFVHTAGGSWQSAWDRATQTPIRVWGEGLPAPGSSASPAIAEAFARRVLADHLALWAPGTAPSDFRLVANDDDGDIRTLGFVQTYRGMDVIGGQMSFRFKRDRLVVIASEAIPGIAVDVPARRSRMPVLRMRQQVSGELAALGLPASAQVAAVGAAEPMVLPIIGDTAVLGFRVVVPHQVEGGPAGRWRLYADVRTGETVGFESQSFYGSGKLLYNVVNRYPGNPAGARLELPANRINVTVGGVAATTGLDGTITWAGEQPQSLVPSVSGLMVLAVNKQGALATTTLNITPNGNAVWDASATKADDAQVNVVAHVNQVKEYVRTFAPAMPNLDAAITTNININMECNASFDGKDLNFYKDSSRCENTGLISDVVFHEYGHAMHFNSIIPGVGRMDGAFSEGLSDFLAVSITEDPGMGRGFFKSGDTNSNTALRDLDPAGKEPRWPEDTGEIHKTGIIFGAAMWDLRKALIASYGRAVAVPLTNRLYYSAVKRASDIPTTLVEILLADDTDGNLANGTPNECAILEHFGKHGLRAVSGISDSPGAVIAAGPGARQEVTFTLLGRSPRCASEVVTKVEVKWSPGPTGVPVGGTTLATQGADADHWVASLPLPSFDAMKYSATMTFASSIKVLLPDNFADFSYQLYEGQTIPLVCANMDQNPLNTASWTSSPGWAWGPAAATGTTDPHSAFTGTNIMAIGLGTDYAPDSTYTLTLPPIDVGNYSDVRLQYRRWLAVEDSHFDAATINANGKSVWMNSSENASDNSALHHIDREWRFSDVPLSGRFRGSQLALSFELTTDGGLEFGGWAIDDLCVVVNPKSICGDGVQSPTEECDDADANSNSPNKCRLDCKRATCGDGIIDRGEECDDEIGTDHCAATCLLMDDSGGCCDAGGNPAASLLVSLGVLALVARRRRREEEA